MRLARRIALPGLGVTVPIITGDPEAGWVGETEKKPVKRGTLATKQMAPYTLAVIVPFSNQFRRDAKARFTTPWCSGCRACWPRSSTPLFSARLTCPALISILWQNALLRAS